MVLTDQQRWDTVGAYGNPMDLTPELDAMADRGTVFEHAFTPQPVCTPARACLQTGQHPTGHGVYRNGLALPRTSTTVADAFNDAGYRTGYVGKWHLASSEDQLGPVSSDLRGGYSDFWRAADVLEHTSHPYEGVVFDGKGTRCPYQRYRTDALYDFAIEFIEERGTEPEPFFLTLSHLEPHQQNDLDDYVAPDGYAERFRNPWVPEDLEHRPGTWYENLPDYYGMCRRLDEGLGRLLDALETAGVRDETIVFFTSDHGCHFDTRVGHDKCSPHEASIRVPAIAEGPGFEDQRVPELLSLIDVAPTLLELSGITPPDAMHGDSFRPVLADDGRAGTDREDDVLVHISGTEIGRALRTPRWKYSVYDPDGDPGAEPSSETYVERYLYDLANDPAEQVNLVGRDDYRGVADDLRARLRDRLGEIGEGPVTIRRAEYPV